MQYDSIFAHVIKKWEVSLENGYPKWVCAEQNYRRITESDSAHLQLIGGYAVIFCDKYKLVTRICFPQNFSIIFFSVLGGIFIHILPVITILRMVLFYF